MDKTYLKIVSFALTLASVGVLSIRAEAASSTPKILHGVYYRYAGHHKWNKLVIKTHSASLSGVDYSRTFIISSKASSANHKLSYKFEGNHSGRVYFNLQSSLKDSAASPFPELGMSLTSRSLNGKKIKVVRGYQSGVWFDFIKGHKVSHDYSGNSNGHY